MTRAKKALNHNCEKQAKACKYENISPLDRSLVELWDNEYDERWNNC
jgi:hypothetical protein